MMGGKRSNLSEGQEQRDKSAEKSTNARHGQKLSTFSSIREFALQVYATIVLQSANNDGNKRRGQLKLCIAAIFVQPPRGIKMTNKGQFWRRLAKVKEMVPKSGKRRQRTE